MEKKYRTHGTEENLDHLVGIAKEEKETLSSKIYEIDPHQKAYFEDDVKQAVARLKGVIDEPKYYMQLTPEKRSTYLLKRIKEIFGEELV